MTEKQHTFWNSIPNTIKVLTGIVTLITAIVGLLFQFKVLPLQSGSAVEIGQNWIVDASRAHFYSAPNIDSITGAYVVAGQTVRINDISADEQFIFTTYVHNGKETSGFIKLSELRRPK